MITHMPASYTRKFIFHLYMLFLFVKFSVIPSSSCIYTVKILPFVNTSRGFERLVLKLKVSLFSTKVSWTGMKFWQIELPSEEEELKVKPESVNTKSPSIKGTIVEWHTF